MSSFSPDVRVSDLERSDAMSALGAHFAEGRLDLAEYEERIEVATTARSRGELDALFNDLPELASTAELVPFYSATEVEAAHRRGAKPKLGILLLSVLGTLLSIAAVSPLPGASVLTSMFALVPPTVFVLLYVLKVGPGSWHAPSPRQLDRQRLAAIRAEHRIEREQQRQLRRTKTANIQTNALTFVERRLGKN